ncbi:FkbM family methyltransferase [Pseudomonas sp. F-14 TE3623]
MHKEIVIAGTPFEIIGDDSYARSIDGTFDPELTELIQRLCDKNSHALDVGGNIGLTALAMSTICNEGKVVAVEPVPRTFVLLQANTSQASNVNIWNFAFGSTPGFLPMQGYNDNLSGSFIADAFHIEEENHFTVNVEVKTIDETFATLGLDRLDFMKIDVEGFELEVLEGALQTLSKYKPRVVLEMNHWCLNMFRRISLPEFRERLLAIFPVVYALEAGEYLDLTDAEEARIASHGHLISMKYTNIVAGFDKQDILARLANLEAAKPKVVVSVIDPLVEDNARLTRDIDQLKNDAAQLQTLADDLTVELNDALRRNNEILASTSWKLTAPIRTLKKMLA